MVITLSTDVIPSKAISLLNFSDESLDSSFANGDLVVFLSELSTNLILFLVKVVISLSLMNILDTT
jgi:hypothetical protein